LQLGAHKTSTASNVIPFYRRMGTPAAQPQDPESGQKKAQESGQRRGLNFAMLGNLAQWAALIITLMIGIMNYRAVAHYREVDSAKTSSDEHIKELIHAQLDPAVASINSSIDKKLDPISRKLDEVASEVSDAEGQLKRLHADVGQQKLEQQRRASLAALTTPDQEANTLAMIQAAILTAQKSQEVLPVSYLANVKQGIQAIPNSTRNYWPAVAAIINYQSYLNQKNGHAPNPLKVARPCTGLTAGSGGNNLIQGHIVIPNCILDLDTTHNVLQGLIFKDSVIRYHGGQLDGIRGVTFVNCNFIVDVSSARPPLHPEILLALLQTDQQRVNLSTSPLGPVPN
jgi:hypothetical protein